MRSLISILDFTTEELDQLITTAKDIAAHPEKYWDACAHKKLATLFFEPSTRTRLSFEAAMLELGGTVLGFSEAGSSSAAKGETVADTAKTVSCYADIIAMRHPREGAPYRLNNLTIGLCGDLKYGRTVHSLIEAMSRYEGIKFVLISPKELQLPSYIRYNVLEKHQIPYTEVETMEEVMGSLDVLYMTRIQRERFDDKAEYERLKDSYVLTTEKMELAKKEMAVLHPLPRVNEISVKVDEDPRAAYFRQALNGKYMRMALILKLLGEAKADPVKEAVDTTDFVYDLTCHNPKCISQVEQELPQIFKLTDKAAGIHRCIYCEQKA